MLSEVVINDRLLFKARQGEITIRGETTCPPELSRPPWEMQLQGYLMQLDFRAKFVSAAAYAHSTLNTCCSQWRTYLWFCTMYHLVPVPAEDQTIMRFLIHFSYYCKYSTVINYLSAINVLHRHFDFNVTFQEVFSIKFILRGLQHILGDAPGQKLPMTPDILLQFHPQLTAQSDSGFWAAMLIGFYTFFRKSNLVPKSEEGIWSRQEFVSQRHHCQTVGFGYLHSLVKNYSISRASVAHSCYAAITGSPSLPRASTWTSYFRIPGHPVFACIPASQKWSRHSNYTLSIHW